MHMDTQFIFFIFEENDDFVKWLTENCGGVFYTVSRCAARTLWGLSNLVKWKGMEQMKRRTARALCAAGLSLSLLAGLVPAMAAGPAEVADSLYINGNIYTVNEDFSTATTMAVKGDRILYVGDQAGAEAYVGAGTEITDLGGKTVLPGLIEGHMHVSNLGENHLKLDCYFKSKEDILEMVRQAAKEAEPGEWIQGSGWLDTLWDEPGFPSKEELDAVAPNNPVYLLRADNHMGWFNSMALEMAGITKDTPEPQGGQILKTDNGELLGCLTDNAASMVIKVIPTWSAEAQKNAVLMAQEELFSYGFTSATDAGTKVNYIQHYEDLYESGELKLRIYAMPMLNSTDSAEAGYIREHRPVNGLYDNHLSIMGVKVLGDGALGSRGSALLKDYSDDPGNRGSYRFTDEEIYNVMSLAYNNGYQIAYHAIGDGANHQVLNTYERLLKENPREDPRLRIEHFQVVTPEDIDRALELGILTAMQFTHATSDLSMAEDRLGPERIQTAYAWRTVLDKGGIIIGGSDAPVEMVNPFHGLYAGVTRMTRAGEPEGGWYANQKVTREEALRAFTIWAAYGQFEEDLKGSLEPGKLADFVVIDRDYMTCPEEEIKDIQALMTVSGGEVVYTKDTSEPTILWQGKPVTLLSGALIEQPGTIYASASDLAGNISAVLERGEGTVTVTCGEQSAELPVKTVNGADYVPVRAFFEGIGYAVTWCPDSRTVSTSRMSTADTSEAAAQPPVDEYSFQLGNFDGTVGAFCDVIMTGAKELAFSDPFDPEDEPLLTSYVAKKCEGYGVKYYIDKDLLLTKLFSTVEMDGQWVYILYADDAVLQEYLELKQEEKDMIAAGTYTEKAQIDLATRYGKLMGYSDAHIAASIAGA